MSEKESSIDKPIDYNSEDSTIIDFQNEIIFLYGDAYVTYDNIDIKADYIEFRYGENLVVAKYTLDSAGEKTGKPVFTEGGESYTMDEIRYNTETKKGVIFNVTTTQSEGYIHSEKIKKHENDHIHLKRGRYTTCDKPNPHYYFRLTKAVVIPDDKIVSGPLNLYLGKIPTPLGLPFGFFPNQSKGTNGIIIPEFGNAPLYGFSLTDGGYYIKFKERADLSLLGTIYSKGSWGAKAITRYDSRYKYYGTLDLSYNVLKEGIKETSSFSKSSNFFVKWNHSQEQTAKPGTRFSAFVNAGSVNNFRTGIDFNATDYLNNRFQSNISYGKSWTGKPYNLSINLRHEQNTNTGLINATLPEVTFNLNRVDPLDIFRRNKVGSKKIKLGFTYSATGKNDISIVDSLINFNNLSSVQNKFRNGIRHSATLSAPIKLFKVFTFNNSINFTDRMYTKTLNSTWNTENNTLENDTLKGFYNSFDYSLNSSLSTTLYGLYGFRSFLSGKRETKIRHVMTPSVSFNYNPNFSTNKTYIDSTGTEKIYSPFDIGVFGKAPDREVGILGFNINNSLEMKVKNLKDSSDNAEEFKKIKLIESFAINSGYDIMKDSFNLSNIGFSARTLLFKVINLNGNASLDPYSYSNGYRTNNIQFSESGFQLGTITNASASIGLNFRSNPKKDEKKYFNPWTAQVNYNYFISRGYNNGAKSERIDNTISLEGAINLTKKWRFKNTTHYDYRNAKIAYVEFDLYRDLHCWEASFNIIPFGSDAIKRYMFRINVKASVLKDLKWEHRRNLYNNSLSNF